VLVDMNKQKVMNGDQTILRNVSLVLSLITTLSFVFNIFK